MASFSRKAGGQPAPTAFTTDHSDKNRLSSTPPWQRTAPLSTMTTSVYCARRCGFDSTALLLISVDGSSISGVSCKPTEPSTRGHRGGRSALAVARKHGHRLIRLSHANPQAVTSTTGLSPTCFCCYVTFIRFIHPSQARFYAPSAYNIASVAPANAKRMSRVWTGLLLSSLSRPVCWCAEFGEAIRKSRRSKIQRRQICRRRRRCCIFRRSTHDTNPYTPASNSLPSTAPSLTRLAKRHWRVQHFASTSTRPPSSNYHRVSSPCELRTMKNNPGFSAGTALVGKELEEGGSEVDRIQRSKEDMEYWESEARNRRGGRNSTSNDMAVVV